MCLGNTTEIETGLYSLLIYLSHSNPHVLYEPVNFLICI